MIPNLFSLFFGSGTQGFEALQGQSGSNGPANTVDFQGILENFREVHLIPVSNESAGQATISPSAEQGTDTGILPDPAILGAPSLNALIREYNRRMPQHNAVPLATPSVEQADRALQALPNDALDLPLPEPMVRQILSLLPAQMQENPAELPDISLHIERETLVNFLTEATLPRQQVDIPIVAQITEQDTNTPIFEGTLTLSRTEQQAFRAMLLAGDLVGGVEMHVANAATAEEPATAQYLAVPVPATDHTEAAQLLIPVHTIQSQSFEAPESAAIPAVLLQPGEPPKPFIIENLQPEAKQVLQLILAQAQATAESIETGQPLNAVPETQVLQQPDMPPQTSEPLSEPISENVTEQAAVHQQNIVEPENTPQPETPVVAQDVAVSPAPAQPTTPAAIAEPDVVTPVVIEQPVVIDVEPKPEEQAQPVILPGHLELAAPLKIDVDVTDNELPISDILIRIVFEQDAQNQDIVGVDEHAEPPQPILGRISYEDVLRHAQQPAGTEVILPLEPVREPVMPSVIPAGTLTIPKLPDNALQQWNTLSEQPAHAESALPARLTIQMAELPAADGNQPVVNTPVQLSIESVPVATGTTLPSQPLTENAVPVMATPTQVSVTLGDQQQIILQPSGSMADVEPPVIVPVTDGNSAVLVTAEVVDSESVVQDNAPVAQVVEALETVQAVTAEYRKTIDHDASQDDQVTPGNTLRDRLAPIAKNPVIPMPLQAASEMPELETELLMPQIPVDEPDIQTSISQPESPDIMAAASRAGSPAPAPVDQAPALPSAPALAPGQNYGARTGGEQEMAPTIPVPEEAPRTDAPVQNTRQASSSEQGIDILDTVVDDELVLPAPTTLKKPTVTSGDKQPQEKPATVQKEIPVMLEYQAARSVRKATVKATCMLQSEEPVVSMSAASGVSGQSAPASLSQDQALATSQSTGDNVLFDSGAGSNFNGDGSSGQQNFHQGQSAAQTAMGAAAAADTAAETAAVENQRFFERLQLSETLIEKNIQSITREAKLLTSEHRSEVRMRLDPPHLGKMTMRLVMQENRLEARMVVETAEARLMLEETMPQLRQSLQDQGVDVHTIDVQVRDQNQSGQQASNLDREESGDERKSRQSPEDEQAREREPERQKHRDGIRGEQVEVTI